MKLVRVLTFSTSNPGFAFAFMQVVSLLKSTALH